MTQPIIPQKYVPGFGYPRGSGVGFTGTIIERRGDWVLVEVTHPDIKQSTYEVAKVLPHNGFSIQGAHIAPSECIAPTSMWGTLGFTYQHRKDAVQKLGQVTAQEGHLPHVPRDSGAS